MAKLSLYARKRIVSLKSSGATNNTIREGLLKEGIKTSSAAVSLFYSRYRRTGRLTDGRRSGRKSILKQEDLDFIDRQMKENDELTSRDLKRNIAEACQVDISSATIRRARRRLGWKKENARYCQFIRDPNKIKRLAFCLKAFTEKDNFENVIFTDATVCKNMLSEGRDATET